MKFGEALPQRSVQEWLPYNLDYNEIKQLIKRYTTGKPLVKSPEAKTDFEDEFFNILMDQLGRIDLFVKSKSGEVDRLRCKRQVAALRRRDTEDSALHHIRRPGRSTKLEQEVERVSYEVQCLSRFVNVQRTGFLKLLKKYKKWTGSSHLLNRFLPILKSPTAFHKVDFEKNVLELSNLLNAIRNGLDLPAAAPSPQIVTQPKRIRGAEQEDPQDRALSIETVLSQKAIATAEGRAYLDTALATSTLGDSCGGRATFWVHYDHLIELQVLLLKYLTLQTSPAYNAPPTPPSRKDSIGTLWKDDEIGVVLLDDLESFSDIQSSATVAEASKACSRTAGQVRWCCRDSDAVVVVSNASALILNKIAGHEEEKLEVRMKRKQIEELLDTGSISSRADINHTTNEQGETGVEKLEEWLAEHKNVTPLVKLLMKRIRFAETPEGGRVWALLDWDIKMTKVQQGTNWLTRPEEDGPGFGSEGRREFPHAVLEVQWEGQRVPTFLHELETSHMVENVRGFSLDVHALSLSALQRDIRKTPVHTPRHSRRSSSHMMFTSAASKSTSNGTSAAMAHDFADGFDSSTTAFSHTAPTVLPKAKSNRPKSGLSSIEHIGGERYWSEFNDDEDDEEPYTILIKRGDTSDDDCEDEDVSLSDFIRKSVFSTGHKFQALFTASPKHSGERKPLLRKPSVPSSESSSEIDVEVGAFGTGASSRAHYNTFSRPATINTPLSPTYVFCLGGAVVILIVTLILAMNSSLARHKHKWRRGHFTLDLEVCGAVLTALSLASIGLFIFLKSRSRAGPTHQMFAWGSFGAVCIGSGVVLAMVGNREVGN
ncbi:unnamed protein product [Tuber melanosporum]|uniref:(Perigord truffle) hypothetical protein n=1 Tax=Tuber melanosporum (strain Mel28) TaxID=656061 RepID=D5G440_TUBMM|nr:uncharacterized protein GSTUM_00003939001 [Tuber melanosporum]CAZ79283.1 unnamed protein product [Tuber melanosporum]